MKFGKKTGRSASVAFLLLLCMILSCAFPVFGSEIVGNEIGADDALTGNYSEIDVNGSGNSIIEPGYVSGITDSEDMNEPKAVNGDATGNGGTSSERITSKSDFVTGSSVEIPDFGISDGGIAVENGANGEISGSGILTEIVTDEKASSAGIATDGGISCGAIDRGDENSVFGSTDNDSFSGATGGNSVSGSTDDDNGGSERDFYFIEVEHSSGGVVNPSGVNGVLAGRNLEIEIIPDPGYYCCTFILDYRYDFSDLAEELRFFEFMNANDDRHVYVGFAKREEPSEIHGDKTGDGSGTNAGSGFFGNGNSSGNTDSSRGHSSRRTGNSRDAFRNQRIISLEDDGNAKLILEMDGDRILIREERTGKENLWGNALWTATIYITDRASIPPLILPTMAWLAEYSISLVNEYFCVKDATALICPLSNRQLKYLN